MSFSPLLAKSHPFRTKKNTEASIVSRHLCIVNFKPTHSLGTGGVKLLFPIKYRLQSLQGAVQMDRAPAAQLATMARSLGTYFRIMWAWSRAPNVLFLLHLLPFVPWKIRKKRSRDCVVHAESGVSKIYPRHERWRRIDLCCECVKMGLFPGWKLYLLQIKM